MSDEQEEIPIVGETLPLMDMPLLSAEVREPNTYSKLWALVQSRRYQGMGEVPTVGPECPWDYKPVADDGDCCNLNCYSMWLKFHEDLASPGNEVYARVQPLELVPKSLEDQPWYDRLL